jgi:hypothetical protein
LKALMRHSKIDTTMSYYVDPTTESAAAEFWTALGKEKGQVADSPKSDVAENPWK